jgi:hypothetical protein
MYLSLLPPLLLAGLSGVVPAPLDIGPASQIAAIQTKPPRGTEPGAAPTLVTSATTGTSTHGPYSGTPTTTGPEVGPSTISATIPSQPNPWATYYNPNGKLTQPQPIPYMPGGMIIFHFPFSTKTMARITNLCTRRRGH